MKKLGIVGGIGPESTVDYYRMYIKEYQAITKDGSYPEIIINSINISKMLNMVGRQDWQGLINYLSEAVNILAQSGAQLGLIASNTPHVVFEEVQALSKIPLLSIVEETCKKTNELGLSKVALLGTGFTMKSDYYQKVFSKQGIDIYVPTEQEQKYIHDKIFSELQIPIVREETKAGFLSIIKRMVDQNGIEGVILGCTELPLILTEDTYGIKFINTSQVHIESAIKYIFSGSVR